MATTEESTKIYAGQFGNLVGLRPVTSIPTTTSNNKTNKTKKTRVVRITEHTWEKLRDFSSKYHEQPINLSVDIYSRLDQKTQYLREKSVYI